MRFGCTTAGFFSPKTNVAESSAFMSSALQVYATV